MKYIKILLKLKNVLFANWITHNNICHYVQNYWSERTTKPFLKPWLPRVSRSKIIWKFPRVCLNNSSMFDPVTKRHQSTSSEQADKTSPSRLIDQKIFDREHAVRKRSSEWLCSCCWGYWRTFIKISKNLRAKRI